jgi:hypothetical protein
MARITGALVVAAIAVSSGCSGGSGEARHRPSATTGGGDESVSYVARTRHRQQLAAAYAERLAAAAPRVGGETTLATVPGKLSGPEQTIGVGNLVTRSRYWSVRGSPQQIYAGLKRASVSRLALSGYGPPGAGSNAANFADLSYDDTAFPSYLSDAELYVEVLGVAGGRSDIAAFAEVVPFPFRQANETIPADGSKVVLERTRLRRSPAAPLRRVTLSSARAGSLITVFDRARISPPGGCIGGLPPAFGYAAAISSAGHRWRISWTGLGNCDRLSVQRDGRPLPDVETPPALLRMFAAGLAGGDGFVDGGFWRVSGGSLLPLAGTVTLSSRGHPVARFVVSRQDGFEFIVPPGRYLLSGRSPGFDNGTVACSGQHPAVVRADRFTRDDVRCRHT